MILSLLQKANFMAGYAVLLTDEQIFTVLEPMPFNWAHVQCRREGSAFRTTHVAGTALLLSTRLYQPS